MLYIEFPKFLHRDVSLSLFKSAIDTCRWLPRTRSLSARQILSISREGSPTVRVQSAARGIMAKLMTNFVNNPSFAKLFPSGSPTAAPGHFLLVLRGECLFMKFRDYQGGGEQTVSLFLRGIVPQWRATNIYKRRRAQRWHFLPNVAHSTPSRPRIFYSRSA